MAARMLVGATSAIYLVSKGISAQDIVYLKAFQCLLILAAEVPLGVLADRVDRRLVIAAGLGSACLWLFLTGFGSGASTLYLAEAFNALSLATFSGAIEAELVDAWSADHGMNNLRALFSRLTTWSFTATSGAALVGGLLAFNDPKSRVPWTVAGMAVFALLLSLLFAYRPHNASMRSTSHESLLKSASRQAGLASITWSNIKEVIKDQENRARLIPVIVLSGALAAAFQLIIQYWQLIVGPNSLTDHGWFFGGAFFLMMLVQSRHKWLAQYLRSRALYYMAALVTPGILLAIGAWAQLPAVLVVLLICLCLWSYQAVVVDINATLAEKASGGSRATVFSIRSTLGRGVFVAFSPVASMAIHRYGAVGITFCVVILTVTALVISIKYRVADSFQSFRIPN
nr:MFS transporter [Mycobacterium decipiens]